MCSIAQWQGAITVHGLFTPRPLTIQKSCSPFSPCLETQRMPFKPESRWDTHPVLTTSTATSLTLRYFEQMQHVSACGTGNITNHFWLNPSLPAQFFNVVCLTAIANVVPVEFIWFFAHTVRRSTIPTRLVSPYPGVDFLGRVEVYYSGQWGTICDNSFSTPEANIICQALNFTQGALCTVPNARYGRGTGIDSYIDNWLAEMLCVLLKLAVDQQGQSGWTTWTVLRKMKSLKTAATEAGGLAIALTLTMLGWSADPMVHTMNPSTSRSTWYPSLPSVTLFSYLLHMYIRSSCREKPYSNIRGSHFNHCQLDCKLYRLSKQLLPVRYYCTCYSIVLSSDTPSQEEHPLLISDFDIHTVFGDHC